MQVLDTTSHLFDDFADVIRAQFASSADPLFQVSTEGLYETYLSALGDRQHHTCSCCRQFIERFGGLVRINGAGEVESAVWPFGMVPSYYAPAANRLAQMAENRPIEGVFLAGEPVWGTPEAGGWTHFSIPGVPFRERLLTPFQAMAQKREDFQTLSRALGEFPLALCRTALNFLEADAVNRSEKFVAPARFLVSLHEAIASARGSHRRALIWRAVASAPPGFATPKGTMIGSLLEDLAAGKSSEAAQRAFNSKMHPLAYQRPQAPASVGNIEQAEKIVERLGIASALQRRFAMIEELSLLWTPSRAAGDVSGNGGVFGHLRAKPAQAQTALGATMTWKKFAEKVLPSATRIEILVPTRGHFTGLCSGPGPDIFKWAGPLSWYVYHSGSPASQWGLQPGWMEIAGLWEKPKGFEGVVAILPSARDSCSAGLALFPETLSSDLHSIRSTIETFSRRGELQGRETGNANGLNIIGAQIRVTSDLGIAEYKIDRWD